MQRNVSFLCGLGVYLHRKALTWRAEPDVHYGQPTGNLLPEAKWPQRAPTPSMASLNSESRSHSDACGASRSTFQKQESTPFAAVLFFNVHASDRLPEEGYGMNISASV